MNKVICALLAFLIFSTSAYATQMPDDSFSVESDDTISLSEKVIPALENGNIAVEAEDMDYSSDAKIIADNEASKGYAITCASAKYASAPEEVANVTMSLKVQVPASEIGRYYLWLRLKTPPGGISYFESYTGSPEYKTKWYNAKSGYYWVKVATVSLGFGLFEYNVKYRDYSFRLDKFIITNDSSFAPEGMDDLPDEMLGIEKDPIAPPPPFTPPAGIHPRVLVRAELIPQIKENMEHPLLATMYKQVRARAFLEMDCHMPDKGTANNVSLDLVFNIQCRAFMYLLGEADKTHAKQTIQHMRDMYDTLVWDSSVGDITRSMGTVLAVSGCVYDWCYDALTEEDKQYFIIQMKYLASMMEIGYPAGRGETFSGHGGEGELFYFQSTAGIAIYDEDPAMYNAAAGVLYEYMFPTRELFNSAGHHPAGTAYGAVRTNWELIGKLVFERLGDTDIMGDEAHKIPYSFINFRYPNGMFLEDGDTWITVEANGPTYSSNDLAMMLNAVRLGDSHVNGEAVKQLSLRGYSAGFSISDNGVIALLSIDPNIEYAYPDDYGKEMPLTHFTSYPITTMTARTSWRAGKDGETAMVFVNGQEKLVGDHDHDHSDIGGFSIYYKGLLTSGTGTYSGSEGGWGIPHYYNYYRRSVSKNCLTVLDPDETYSISGYPLKYDLANEGGQKLEQNTTTLPEYLSHPDEAKTVGTYAGPNRETPEFSYLKTDLTDAYSDKITGYTRSTVSLNLFNTDYPLAFICYDNVSSSNASFKKTWNLQSIDTEPVTVNNVTTISRNDYGYTGKLVVNTLLPEGGNAVFENVGGEGKESFSGGVNYPNPAAKGHEAGLWRLELSPKASSKDDIFLNAMFVTDKEKNLPDLPMTKVETSEFVGVSVMDRLVLFSKQRESVSSAFTLNIPASSYETTCVFVTDVVPGKWQVTGPDGSFVTEVKAEENVLYARLTAGDYSFTKVDEGTQTVMIDYPRDERVLRVGDALVYEQSNKRFAYTRQPTAIKDDKAYISEDDFRAYGANVTVDGNKVTLSRGAYTEVLTIGDNNAVINGSGVVLNSAPFIAENGKVYICATEHGRILRLNTSYDSFARILKVSPMTGAEEKISISMPNGALGDVCYSSDYSPYTIKGTQMIVRPDTVLKSGQKIAYFLNGVKVGESTKVSDYIFKSVYGVNKMQAKIMEGDTVIALSNIIEKQFAPLVKNGKDIYSNDLSAWDGSKFYYNKSPWISFTDDPASENCVESVRKVMKVEKTSDNITPNIQIKKNNYNDYFNYSDTGSGIIKYDYKIYVENLNGKIDMAQLWFGCGENITKHNGDVYTEELSGEFTGTGVTRSHYLPKNRWVDVSIVIDNDRRVYDVTVDGVQVTTGRAFCTHADDNSYLKTLHLPTYYYGDSATYYLKDVKIYKCASGVYSDMEYINNGKIVTKTCELTNSDDLTVKFNAYRGDVDEVFCIAALLRNENELISISHQTVSFDAGKEVEGVNLTLKNLPSDIAGGNYFVNVMIWNENNLKPIVSKIVMH